ncbi:MAG: hypothetical protein EA412_00875, partial [Chitinophagaceae bacterium]
QNNIDNPMQALGYLAVGAAAGVASAGVGIGLNNALIGNALGSVTHMSTGFFSGAVIGAGSGFTGGFITGTGNAIIQGNPKALEIGLKYGGYGALSGFVIGGVSGGIDAIKHDRDFWTGAKEIDIVVFRDRSGNMQVTSKDAIGDNDFVKRAYRINLTDEDWTLTEEGFFSYKLEIPHYRKGRVLIAGPENQTILSHNTVESRRFVTIQSIDRLDYVILRTTKYQSRPIQRLPDLFYHRATFIND